MLDSDEEFEPQDADTIPLQSPSWLERLKVSSRIGKELFISPEQVRNQPYAQTIRNALGAGATGVFCIDGIPCTAVVSYEEESVIKDRFRELYTNLWNEGIFDFLLIFRRDRVELHSLGKNPESLCVSGSEVGEATSLLEVMGYVEQAADIAEIISGMESGRLVGKYKSEISVSRVDRELINDLEAIRKEMVSAARGENISEIYEQVHAVLLEAIFIMYLEDRGIIDPIYRSFANDAPPVPLHELLKNHPERFECLIEQLDRALNGGIFTPDPLWRQFREILADFLEGLYSFHSKRYRLLRIYRFDKIPVELLSEIYDRFVMSEKVKREQGRYYTPRFLAVLMVEQIWTDLEKKIKAGRRPLVLDPACGSGIFLATIFNRIADNHPNPSWPYLKKLAESLHGIDIDRTAIRISAFSLYLALLNRRTPGQLRKSIRLGSRILPPLINKTLFVKDFYDWQGEFGYDCIIGNPPWGTPKNASQTQGEMWLKAQNRKKSGEPKLQIPAPPNRERSWPFIWKSLQHLKTGCPICLLLPTTGFMLNKVRDSLVRLLGYIRLQKIMDLSDLRHLIFNKSASPACVLHGLRHEKLEAHDFMYVCPKTDMNMAFGDRILLASDDIHDVSAWEFANDTVRLSQRLMWMSPLERRLLRYVDTLPTLNDLPLLGVSGYRGQKAEEQESSWGAGLGFQAIASIEHDRKIKPDLPELLEMPHGTKENIYSWHSPSIESSPPYATAQVRVKNFPEAFKAPHIVFRRSFDSDGRLRACYSEDPFSFNDTFIGIRVPNSDKGRKTAKLLTAVLNSTFMGWIMEAKGSVVERPRLKVATLFSLPFPTPEAFPNQVKAHQTTEKIIALFDDLCSEIAIRHNETLKSPDESSLEAKIRKLDDLVFSYFDIREEEREIIRENVGLIRKAAQPGRNSKVPKIWEEADRVQREKYLSYLEKALTEQMSAEYRVVASICHASRDMGIVKIERQARDADGSFPEAVKSDPLPLNGIPPAILEKFEKDIGGNLYLKRVVIVVERDVIYLVKPAQYRFWLVRNAYSDCDLIIDQLFRAVHLPEGAEE